MEVGHQDPILISPVVVWSKLTKKHCLIPKVIRKSNQEFFQTLFTIHIRVKFGKLNI